MAPPLRDMVEAVVARHGCSTNMAATAALSAIATIIQGRTRVVAGADGWSVPATIWMICAAPPGALKSTIAEEFWAPLRAHQQAQLAQSKADYTAWAHRRDCARVRVRQLQAVAQPSYAQTEALAQAGQEAHSDPPGRPLWICTDINQANLPKILDSQQTARGVASVGVLDTEDDFLANYLGRHCKHIQAGPLNHGYEGEDITQVRSSRVNDDLCVRVVSKAHVSLGLIINSRWMHTISQSADLSESGMVSRCLLTSCRRPTRPSDAPEVPEDARAAWTSLVAALLRADLPETVTLDPEEMACVSACQAHMSEFNGDDLTAGQARAHARLARLLGLNRVVMNLCDRESLGDAPRASGGGGAAHGISWAGRDPPQLAHPREVDQLLLYIISNTNGDLSRADQASGSPTYTHHRIMGLLSTNHTTLARGSSHSHTGPQERNPFGRRWPEFSLRELQQVIRTRTYRPRAAELRRACDELCEMAMLNRIEPTSRQRRTKEIWYEYVPLSGESPCAPPVASPAESSGTSRLPAAQQSASSRSPHALPPIDARGQQALVLQIEIMSHTDDLDRLEAALVANGPIPFTTKMALQMERQKRAMSPEQVRNWSAERLRREEFE